MKAKLEAISIGNEAGKRFYIVAARVEAPQFDADGKELSYAALEALEGSEVEVGGDPVPRVHK